MRSNSKNNFWIFVLLGAIGGSFLGEALGNSIKELNFLKTTYSIGTPNPFILNLKVIEFTFGVNFNINIMTIVGVILAIILYRKY